MVSNLFFDDVAVKTGNGSINYKFMTSSNLKNTAIEYVIHTL